MSQFSATAFLNLGNAFKNYAIANIISIASGFIIAIIMQTTIFIPFMDITSETDVIELVYTLIPIIAVFGIIGFGIGIFMLVRYFQYISALKHAGEEANDPNLTRAYRMEVWGLILSIVLPVILIIALTSIIPNIMNIVFNNDPYDPYYPDESIIYAIIAPIMLITVLVSLASLIIIIFKIVAKFAIDNWASEIVNMYAGNPYAINLHEGTTFMKWGVVVQICFGSIGSIVFIIGLFRAGKNAVLLFSIPPAMTPTNTQQPPYSGYGAGPNFQSYYQPNVSGTTMRPSSSSAAGSSLCPACGTMLPDPNARYCPNCGRAL